MNRKQFLRKLLQKAQQGVQFYKTHAKQLSQQGEFPLKRFQVLHLGLCQIEAPTQQKNINPPSFKPKQNCRKILAAQKSQSNHKRQNSEKESAMKKYSRGSERSEKTKKYYYKSSQLNHPEFLKHKIQKKQTLLENYQKAISRRSLTVSDSTEQQNEQLEKKQEKIKQIHSQSNSNSGFYRNYSSKKSFVKKKSTTSEHVPSNAKKKENESKIVFRRQLVKTYAKPYHPPPKISAKAYIVYQKLKDQDPQFKIHASLNSKNSLEMASLTKIMTCILGIKICERYSLQPRQQIIKIGKFQSKIGGTSAKIEPGDFYTLDDLFYGLMLPSGNDASLAIAVWGGKQLLQRQRKNQFYSRERKYTKKQCYERFLREMNAKSIQLKLSKTNYANSHGLSNSLNRSCAYDIAHLSQYSMESSKFRQIVSTKEYSKRIKTQIKNPMFHQEHEEKQEEQESSQSDEDQESNCKRNQEKIIKKSSKNLQPKYLEGQRSIYWENTHKLLWKKGGQYYGIKTGVTTTAGPCLSSLVRSQSGRQFYIIVLHCKKLFLRFKQTQILKKWLFKQENIKNTNNLEKEENFTQFDEDDYKDDQLDQ